MHTKVSLPKVINSHYGNFDMRYATIKFGKYLVIKPAGINNNAKIDEPICLKFIVTLHRNNSEQTPYSYQFSNSEIVDLLKGDIVAKKSRGHLIDFEFLPFDKYDNQKRPTTGKLTAKLSMNDPEVQEWWDTYVSNAQYDQGVDGSDVF